MYINFTIEDNKKNIGEGPIQVGWFLTEDKSAILFEPPYRMRSQSQTKHAKSPSRCPAVLQLESRYFVINCPFDFHLRFVRDAQGKLTLVNVLGDQSPVRTNKLRELLTRVNENEWQTPQILILQLKLPYCFIADEVVYLTQFDGFDPSRTIKLHQSEKTPELMQYMEQISGVVNYVNQTFSLFSDLEKVRPKNY